MNGSLATSKRNGISWTYVVARATVLVTTSYATRLRFMRRDYSATYMYNTESQYSVCIYLYIPSQLSLSIQKNSDGFFRNVLRDYPSFSVTNSAKTGIVAMRK